MLDDDKDELITFSDFSMQMSAFMSSEAENQASNEQKTFPMPHNNPEQEICASQELFPSIQAEKNRSSPDSNSKNDPISLSTSDHFLIKSSTQVSLKPENDVTMTLSNPKSKKQADQSASEVTAETSPFDSIINDPEDSIQRYQGAPPYRRRRRSTQPSLRHARRRSSRVQSLPYYHPMSKRKVEECPLFFLTEDNEK